MAVGVKAFLDFLVAGATALRPWGLHRKEAASIDSTIPGPSHVEACGMDGLDKTLELAMEQLLTKKRRRPNERLCGVG